jgi:hypothetical protein
MSRFLLRSCHHHSSALGAVPRSLISFPHIGRLALLTQFIGIGMRGAQEPRRISNDDKPRYIGKGRRKQTKGEGIGDGDKLGRGDEQRESSNTSGAESERQKRMRGEERKGEKRSRRSESEGQVESFFEDVSICRRRTRGRSRGR